MKHDAINVRLMRVDSSQASHMELRYCAVLAPHYRYSIVQQNGAGILAKKMYELLSISWECYLQTPYDRNEGAEVESKWEDLKVSTLKKMRVCDG